MKKAIFMLIIFSFTVSANIFTVVPETQYVYLNDTVTFECATNLTGYTLFFKTNPSVATSQRSDMLPNGGVITSLNLTAGSEVNDTAVTCFASNRYATKKAYVYVQGPPDSVINLQGYQLDYCCMFISWDPPYTLPGLTVQYIISVGTEQHELNSTNYTYCPLNISSIEDYLFIATINEAGNGPAINITIGFTYLKFLVIYLEEIEYRMNNYWSLHFLLPAHQFCSKVSLVNITVTGCTASNSSECYSTTNVSTSNNSYGNISLVADIILPSRKMLDTQVSLYYENEFIFYSNAMGISTHNLQQLRLVNITFNEVCLQFHFLDKSTSNSTYIHITTESGIPLLNYYIIPHSNKPIFTHCIVDIPVGDNLTLYACDSMINCLSNPAAMITGINITSILSITEFQVFLTFTSSVPSSSEFHVILTSTSSALIFSTSNSVVATADPSAFIALICGILALVVFLIVVLLITCLAIIGYRRIKFKKVVSINNTNTHTTAVAPNSIQLNYIDIELDPDAPAVPPPYDPSPTAYSEIKPETTTTETYDKVCHDGGQAHHSIAAATSNETYSRLNVGAAPVYDKCQHNSTIAVPAPQGQHHNEYSKLSMGQTQSIGQYSFVTTDNMSATNEIPLVQKELTHKDLSIHVTPRLTIKFREVGLALALTPPQLDDIEENHQGISDVFQIWEDLETRPFTWETLLSALRSPVVNEPELANELLKL